MNEQPRYAINQPLMYLQEEPRGASMLIEIPVVNNASTSIPFPVVSELQSDTTQEVVIKSIRLITDQELAFAPTDGNINAPLTELQKISVILYAEGWNKGYLIPILSLNNTFIEGSGIPYRDRTTKLANWQKVMWNKCTLEYSNGSGGSLGAPYSVIVEVEYVRYDTNGMEIIGPSN